MAMNFPDSPSVGDRYTVDNQTWEWTGTTWDTVTVADDIDTKVDKVNGEVTTADTGSNVVRNITLSTSAPTGGSDGDVWLVYTA